MVKESKIKRRFLAFISSRMVYNGYTVRAAMQWKNDKMDNLINDHKTPFFYKLKSYRYGYLPNQMRIFKITKKNRKNFLSYKDYLYLNGANGKYSKWLVDIVTTNKIFKNFTEDLTKIYYQMYIRDGRLKMIAFDKKLSEDEDGFFNFIKKQKSVLLMYTNYKIQYLIEYKNNKFYLDEEEIAIESLKKFIFEEANNTRSLVLTENIVPSSKFKINGNEALLYLNVYNKNGLEPAIGEIYVKENSGYATDQCDIAEEISDENIIESYKFKSYNRKKNIQESNDNSRIYFDEKTGKFRFFLVKRGDRVIKLKKTYKNEDLINLIEDNFEELNKKIIEIFKTVPQIEIAGVTICFTENGFKITNIHNNPEYCNATYFNKDYSDFLKYKYDTKRTLYKSVKYKINVFRKKLWLKLCKLFAKTCYPKGLVPYISFRWLRDIKDDFIENKNIPLKTKLWAYRHGFLSYRLAQYGITKENYKNFISDFEYKWLRHIDNYYKIWFEDKITIKYIASDYNKFFPKYYYFITLKQGENQIIPMMDCPKGLGNTYDDIIKLVKKEGDIALKRDKGSHGEGFYRLTYKNNKLYLNLKETTKDDIVNILSDKSNEYLVTEYIKQVDVLNNIYDGSVNTIRIIVFKKDGKTSTIGNTYMRFGSKKTGTVDNIGAGGISVNLDEETGYFHDALIITDDLKIVPCKEHPDSHLPIEGYIPNWDKVLKDIIEIANSLEQIEYFGFDVAITKDGMKFPEINRYPDYMKIGKLKPHSIKYLLEKVEQKKKRYGYDKKMPHKIFKFIDRRESRR